jgi:hypothetical protein
VAWVCLIALGAGCVLPGAAPAGPPPAENGETVAEPEREDPVSFLTNRRSRSRRWGLIGSGVGLVSGVGLALWVKSEADDRYDLYLNTADPDAAREALDAAQRYDRATLIGWALAQVSFVAFVYFLTREGKRPLVPAEGEPLVRPYEDGFEIGFRVTP